MSILSCQAHKMLQLICLHGNFTVPKIVLIMNFWIFDGMSDLSIEINA